MESTVKRGDIFYADLSPVVGSEQGGTRPVLIVQNDTGNRHSPTVIAAAITSQTGKARLPTHINIAGGSVGLTKDSVILLEQIRTIDKRRLREHMGRLDDKHILMEVTRDYIINYEIDYYFLHSELTQDERDFFCSLYERLEVDYIYNIALDKESVLRRKK